MFMLFWGFRFGALGAGVFLFAGFVGCGLWCVDRIVWFYCACWVWGFLWGLYNIASWAYGLVVCFRGFGFSGGGLDCVLFATGFCIVLGGFWCFLSGGVV